MIENPQPAWLPLLLLAVPGMGFAAYALNEALFPSDDRPRCTIPAIAMVLALLPTHVLALTFGSLSAGLAAAWSIIGAAGYAWMAVHRREFASALSIRHELWPRRLGIALLATLPIVAPTILLNYSDETAASGHQTLIAHLQNGIYPPRYVYEPSLPRAYHLAFDLAGAIVTGLLRIRVDQAIDLLALALWPFMFLLLWRAGEHFEGRTAGLFVAVAVCFSGGWPALAFPWTGSPCNLCTINGLRVNYPFFQYFFQRPWDIGVPIFCLVMLQRAAISRLGNRPLPAVALACWLVMLSLSEAVLFVMTVAAMALAEVWGFIRCRDRAQVTILLCLAASVLGAKLIGGVFTSAPFPPSIGLFHTGFLLTDFSRPHAALSQIQWDLASFGILPALGIAGILRARGSRPFLLMLAMVPFVIVNLLHYQYTWDFVKFGTVSLIAFSIGAGIALSELIGWANAFGRRLVFVLLILSLFGQIVPYPFLVFWAYDPGPRPPFSINMIRPYFSTAYPVDADDARAVSFLRTHMDPSEIVYRAPEKSEPYSIWGGLPTQDSWEVVRADDYPAGILENDEHGLGEAKFAARRALARISPDWLDRLFAEHVTWVVADPDDVAINAVLDCPEGRQRAMLTAEYGKIRIYHLK
jgi:hypothetical protein